MTNTRELIRFSRATQTLTHTVSSIHLSLLSQSRGGFSTSPTFFCMIFLVYLVGQAAMNRASQCVVCSAEIVARPQQSSSPLGQGHAIGSGRRMVKYRGGLVAPICCRLCLQMKERAMMSTFLKTRMAGDFTFFDEPGAESAFAFDECAKTESAGFRYRAWKPPCRKLQLP